MRCHWYFLRNRIVWNLAVLLVIAIPVWGQSGSPDADQESLLRHFATKGLVAKPPYSPITPRQRVRWVMKSTLGPESLIAGVLSAGIGTAEDRPKEYGPSWGGFGERYGIRLTGVSTGNAIEAGLGAIWGEDPRYDRLPEEPFGDRLLNTIKLTFTARYTDGHLGPAYARFIAIAGNNVLSNMWRAEGDRNAEDTGLRMAFGILGRMGANAFVEFWPDVRRRFFPPRPAKE